MSSNNIMTTISNITFVPETEYNKILNENINLKLKISELYNNEENLKETIKINILTIKQLNEENIMLKQKIQELEENMTKQNIKINDQNIKINELSDKLNLIESKNIFNKFVIAIQDLNSSEKLETKLSKNDKINIIADRHIRLYEAIKLKKNRISECHYINNDDEDDLLNDKIIVLLNKLENMDESIKNMFNKKYPNLINSILHDITRDKTLLSQDNLEIINDWWD